MDPKESLEVRSYMALSDAGRDAISLMIRAKLQLESAYDAMLAPAFVPLRAVTVCNQ